MTTVFKLPYTFLTERYLTPKRARSPFVQQASPFQDFVIRCVRYAFANIPAKIGRVFFSREVSLPFLRFRMLRHGIREPPPWEEVGSKDTDGVRGVVISHDRHKAHDVVVYYCHGGGFSMGSAYFYLEPLIVLHTLLKRHCQHPAIFALEYDLVPDRIWPAQLQEVKQGYHYAVSLAGGDSSRVCLSGDSAGGTLVLSLLLKLSHGPPHSLPGMPGYAALLSPWVKLVSDNNQNTASDYLNVESLQLYGSQYAGSAGGVFDPEISPGCCTDLSRWRAASPKHGLYITYGSEEVLGPEIRILTRRLRKAGVNVSVKEEPGAVHAWVIARLFLAETLQERLWGMEEVVKAITTNI